MKLALWDWIIIGAYMAFAIIIGVVLTRRASRSMEDFFISGRSLPWWLAGTSMAATNFSADTPLAVTGIVAKDGVAGNWFAWTFALGGMMATFLFSRLWRRARVVTDAEVIELRYSGRSAAGLRLFKGFYFGVVINCYVMGWVMQAMTKIVAEVMDWDRFTIIFIMSLIALVYTVLSGFWGVVVTDLVQFVIASVGSIVLAVFALDHVGGVGGLKERLIGLHGADHHMLDFFPSLDGESSLPFSVFLVYVTMQWWAQKYADGGGKIIQRMSAAKDERQAVLSTLWFTIANYGISYWPWIVTALVSLVVYPHLADPEAGYPRLMVELLPTGVLGLVVVSLLGAFMSTIDTHLNLGASYLVNDVYKRFINREAPARHYVLVSRLVMVGLMLLSCLAAWQMRSVAEAWKFILAFSSGAGLTFIVRWFWWRANAATEIAGILSSGITAIALRLLFPLWPLTLQVPLIVAVSTACWLVATWLTPPCDEKVLIEFYRRVRPGSPWWGPIARKAGIGDCPFLRGALFNFLLGGVFIYLTLFGIGHLILGSRVLGLLLLTGAVGFFPFILRRIGEAPEEEAVEEEGRQAGEG